MRGETSAAREPETAGQPRHSAGSVFDYASAALGIVGDVTWMVLSASATGPVGVTVGLGLGAAGFFGGCLALLSKLSSSDETQKRGR